MLTFPACAHTIAGPSPASSVHASSSARIRPCSSAATRIAVPRPRPSSRRALNTVACDSALVITRSAGAPARPRSSTSQPARASTALRAAASAVTLAICAPLTSPTPAPGGRPSSCLAHPATVSSAAAAAGDIDLQAGVLVPGRRQPVRPDRDGQRAAGDEAEVARAGARDEPRLGGRRERVDDGDGVRALLGQRAAQPVRLARGADGPLGQRREPRRRQLGGAPQGGVAHGRTA